MADLLKADTDHAVVVTGPNSGSIAYDPNIDPTELVEMTSLAVNGERIIHVESSKSADLPGWNVLTFHYASPLVPFVPDGWAD